MTLKSLALLGSTTACAVVLAISTSISWSSNDVISDRGNPFVPSVADHVNDIHVISVEDAAGKSKIVRDGAGFFDASGFPIRLDVVRDLIKSISALTIDERKTADPTRHGDLDLAAPGAEDGAGKKISLQSKNGDEIAVIIVGKTDYTVGGGSGGSYVRHSDSDQTYLVRGTVKLPYGRDGWFDTNLFEIEEAKLVRATLSNAESAAILFKSEKGKLNLAELPEGKVSHDARIGRIARSFKPLAFEDVRSAKDGPIDGRPFLSIETEAGLTVKLVSVEKLEDGKHWVRISAISSDPGSNEEVKSLAKKLDGFDFKLGTRTSEIFGWTIADLTQSAEG